MKQFPFQPMGDVCICKKISSDYTKAGLYLPEGKESASTDKLVIAEVVAVPMGGYTSTGLRIPPEVAVGDTIAVAFSSAKKMVLSMKEKLMDLGWTDDELKDICIVIIPHIMGKFIVDVKLGTEPVVVERQ